LVKEIQDGSQEITTHRALRVNRRPANDVVLLKGIAREGSGYPFGLERKTGEEVGCKVLLEEGTVKS